MFIDKILLEEFGAEITELRENPFKRFDSEVPFIHRTIDVLDNINISKSGQSLQTKVKEYHSSTENPFYVSYPRPSWVKDVDPELADLLFVVNFHDHAGVVHRRGMLSQAKHTNGDADSPRDWNWPVSMHQYILLRGMTPFRMQKPATGRCFWIRPARRSFLSYSFASDFTLPFFYSVSEMDQFLKTKRGSKMTQFEQENSAQRPQPIQYLFSIVKRFLAETWGERFERGDGIYQFIDHIYRHVDFDRSTSAPRLPDGGEPYSPNDDGPPEGNDLNPEGYSFGVVQFDIGPSDVDFGTNDEEGLRL